MYIGGKTKLTVGITTAKNERFCTTVQREEIIFMKKKIWKALSAFLIVAMLVTSLCLSPVSAVTSTVASTSDSDSWQTYGDFYYTVSNNVATIEKYKGSEEVIEVPSIINDTEVLYINYNAFESCDTIKEVTIQNGIKTIGSCAFANCPNLETVVIPESVTTIDAYTFENCPNLKSVTIPNSIKGIPSSMFTKCTSLESINLPDSLTSIDNWAFNECTSLKEITIPSNVKRIGWKAFFNCTDLKNVNLSENLEQIDVSAFAYTAITSISIPEKVTSIALDSFDFCESLENITGAENNEIYCSIDGVLFTKEKDRLWKYPSANSREEYTVPDGVEVIEDQAFIGRCPNLKKINIPASLGRLSQIYIYCEALENIEIDSKHLCNYSKDGVMFWKSLGDEDNPTVTNWLKCYPVGKKDESYTIPDDVDVIDGFAFYGNKNLVNVTIPKSVTRIGGNAFTNTNLKTITIPATVTQIDDLALGYYYIYPDMVYYDGLDENGEYHYPYAKVEDFTIIGQKGTAAEKYAQENGFNFVAQEAKAEYIELNSLYQKLEKGKSFNLNATVYPDNTDNKAVEWASSNSDIASVDDSGKITANSAGEAYITCTATDGSGTYSTCTVIVYEKVSSVKLNKSSLTLSVDKTATLKATVTPSTANKSVSWKSSNSNVATVNSNGTVKAIGVGKATITCTAKDGSGKKSTCTVYVAPKAPTKLTVKKASSKSNSISWSKSKGAKGYVVYRSSKLNGTYKKLKTTTINKYTNSGLKKGSKYYYKVKAYATISGKKYYSSYSSVKGGKFK
jgi:hypothetical protein